MKNYERNIIVKKSFQFSLRIVDLYEKLIEKKHFVLAQQVMRSGTSIGANVREAQRAVSKADFINKMGIALKEAEETEYWFDIIDAKVYTISSSLKSDLTEIIKLLVSIINSAKANSK